MILCPRLHLFEINDQPWWPQFLREKVQSCLTLAWTFRVPIVQSQTPADLVASTLARVLGLGKVTDYVYVDFASGAGGPTPYIERQLNQRIQSSGSEKEGKDDIDDGGGGEEDGEAGVKGKDEKAMFVLTDLRPHVSAWEAASKKSENLRFVGEGVDAADAPRNMLERVPGLDGTGGDEKKKKVMRLFSLAFHHFDDELAERILRNTVETSDGFGIFELQSRTFSSLITVFLFGPLIGLLSPIFFWRSPLQLFFTYVIPLIPLCLVYDGYVSSLRTRTPEEVEALLRKANGGSRLEGWRFMSGEEMHTDPTGWMSWIVCVKD